MSTYHHKDRFALGFKNIEGIFVESEVLRLYQRGCEITIWDRAINKEHIPNVDIQTPLECDLSSAFSAFRYINFANGMDRDYEKNLKHFIKTV